jgi:hypothetical protein
MTKSLSTTSLKVLALLAFTFILAGCTHRPEVEEMGVTVDDPEFTTITDDDSLEALEAEIDATMIEDEDTSFLKDGEAGY